MRATLIIVAMVAPLFAVTPSLAQGIAPTTVPGGLFGTTRSRDRDWFNVAGTVSEAFDSNVPLEFRESVPVSDIPLAGGASTMLLGAADYARTRGHLQIAATGFGAYRYQPSLDRFDTMGQSAGFGAVITLPARASVRVDQTVTYSPSYLYQLFPAPVLSLGEAIPVAPDYQVAETDSLMYLSNATFSMNVRHGTRVTASASYERTDFRGALAEQPQLSVHSLSGGVFENIRKNVQFSAEYSYIQSDFGLGVTSEQHVALGAEYSRAVSRSRHLTFRGHITPTVVVSDYVMAPSGARTSGLQGDVGVDYEFRPGWKASGTWQRQINYIAVVPSPLLANSGRATVTGLITRRFDLMVSAAYAKSETIVTTQLSRIDSRATNVRMRYALSRSVALYGEYVQYNYDYANGFGSVGSFLPGAVHEHGLRIGAMFWKSIFSG